MTIRRAGVATPGSIDARVPSSQNGTLTVTPTSPRSARRREHVDVALDERRLGDDVHGFCTRRSFEAAARELVRASSGW